MKLLQKSATLLLSGCSKTEKFNVALSLLKKVFSALVIGLTTRDVNLFSPAINDAKKTFNVQLVDFLEVFKLLDSESQDTIINSLKDKQNG